MKIEQKMSLISETSLLRLFSLRFNDIGSPKKVRFRQRVTDSVSSHSKCGGSAGLGGHLWFINDPSPSHLSWIVCLSIFRLTYARVISLSHCLFLSLSPSLSLSLDIYTYIQSYVYMSVYHSTYVSLSL